ncbi:DNA mismatch repair protein MLH3 isoform X4 [Daucus carota subsp. sativus]
MLHEFDVSDGILKISGYISGPGKTFPGKAVQYVYINSRFVWKGPIHKLLSQLAAKFDDIGTSNDFSGPGNGKRSRSQTNPSYILNLSCPSSLYDLTFEPSKTSAEFKDWDHILTFLEKAITNIWNKCMLNGHCLSDDALRNDNTWKEGINSVTTEDMESHYEKKRKRCEHQLYQAALEVPLHRKMLKESFNYMSPCSGNTFSGLKSSRTTSESEKNQEKISSTAQLCDGALSLFREAIDQENGCHLEAPVSKVYFAEDHLFENKVTAEISNEHMDSLMEAKCNMSHIDDDGITDMLAVSGSAHCFEASNDVEEISDTLNVNKYFLKGCSSRRGLSPGKAFSLSKGINFKSKGLESQEHCTDRACEVGVRVVVDSPIHESGKDERASVWCSPGFTNKDVMFMGPDTTTRAPMQLFQMVACFDEDTDLSLDLGNQFQKYGPRESSSKFGWSCVTPDSSAETKFMEADHVSNDAVQDKCKMNSYHYSGDKGCISGFDNMGYNFGHLNCFASSRIEDSGLGDYPSSQKDACDFRVDDVEYDFLPNVFDFHSDKVKGSCSKPVDRDKGRSDAASSSRVFLWNNEDANADGRSEIRGGEKAYGKRPRSHSAPPYYRGKKKFSILNSLSYTEALNAQVVSTHDASILKETYVVENNKQLSGVCRPSSNLYSVNGLINNMRPDMRRAGFNEAQDCETPTDFQNFHANMHSEGKSLETRDLPASKMKWRSSSQLSTSEENSNNLHNKDADILDISSGILHLAGDVLVPKVIEKDALRGAKVLQQVDRKYIPVVGGGVLAFIDQHAADERIRLEELRSKVLAGEMKTMTYLDVEQELVLPEFGHQLLQNYAELIRNWGWICSINTQSSRNFKKNLKLLHSQSSVATLIAVPCILGVNLTDGDLLEFLQQLSDTDGTSTVPPSVIRVLNFKACRGAIMFGDVLLPSECSLIVEELKQTSLCFQCAHGRPTTAPLVNLELLHEQILKLGLRGSSNELWQGLRRHEVSLKRAVQRLDAARDH